MHDHVSGIEVAAPVGRYIDMTYPYGVRGVDTAAMEGSGRFRQRPLPWLPFTNTISPDAVRVAHVPLVLVSDTGLRMGAR